MLATLMLLLAGLNPAQAQSLALTGACPGDVELSVTDATPGTDLMLLVGRGEGAAPVPGGPCRDVDTGLAGPLRKFGPFRDSDGDGALTLRPRLSGDACLGTFAFIDVETCGVSNSEQFGDPVPVGNVIYVAQGRSSRSYLGPWSLSAVDLDTGAVTTVGDLGVGITGLSVGPDGAMWAVEAGGRAFPNFYTLNTSTASLSVVSESSDAGSMSGFAWRDGELLAWSESGDILGIVDPATGTWSSTGISNSTGGHCMATNAAGEMYRMDRAELFLTAPDGLDVKIGDVSGLGSWSGHGCTFHEGQLYTNDASGLLYTVDVGSLSASSTGIMLPDHVDALGSYTP